MLRCRLGGAETSPNGLSNKDLESVLTHWELALAIEGVIVRHQIGVFYC